MQNVEALIVQFWRIFEIFFTLRFQPIQVKFVTWGNININLECVWNGYGCSPTQLNYQNDSKSSSVFFIQFWLNLVGGLIIGKLGQIDFLFCNNHLNYTSNLNLMLFHMIPHITCFYHVGCGLACWCKLAQDVTFCHLSFTNHRMLFHLFKLAISLAFT